MLPLTLRQRLGVATLILLLAATLRIMHIPPGLHPNEAPFLLGNDPFLMRMAHVYIGLLTIALSGWSTRMLFEGEPRREWLSLFTMGMLATLFWVAVLDTVLLPETFFPLVSALTVGCLFKAWHTAYDNRARWGWLLAASIVAGLGAYITDAARLLYLLVILCWLGMLFIHAHFRRHLLEFIASISVTLLVASPMWSVIFREFTMLSTLTLTIRRWRNAVVMLFAQGDPLIIYNLPGKPLFGWLLGAFIIMGWVLTIRKLLLAQTTTDRIRNGLLVLWPIVFMYPITLRQINNLYAVGLLPYTLLLAALALTYLQERLLPYVLAIFLVFSSGIGYTNLYTWAQNPQLYYAYDAHLTALNRYLQANTLEIPIYVTAISRTLLDDDITVLPSGDTLVIPAKGEGMFAVTRGAGIPSKWAEQLAPYQQTFSLGPDGRRQFTLYRVDQSLPLLTNNAESTFGDILILEGVQSSPVPSAGTAMIDATWHVIGEATRDDYVFTAQICDQWGWCWQRIGRPIEQNTTYPSRYWQVGERFVTRFEVSLPKGTPPGDYVVRLSVLPEEGGEPLSVGGEPKAFAEVNEVHVEPTPVDFTNDIPLQYPREQAISPDIIFFGHDLPRATLSHDEPMVIALYWLALEDDYSPRMVRLYLDEILLIEREPVHGTYPTTEWEAGELIIDRYRLPIPRTVPSGTYTLSVEIGNSWRFNLHEITITD